MTDTVGFVPIAHIRGGYTEKFGGPRQSGLTDGAEAVIIFEPPFRDANALRGIEGYSHLWLLWYFSGFAHEPGAFSPTVRPPRLGGNTRVGVFATRSPNRPNPIGLSSVRLLGVEKTAHDGTVLRIADADLIDGTPIFDIKPYLAFTDAHPDAVGGFAEKVKNHALAVHFDTDTAMLSPDALSRLTSLIAADPRPGYQRDDIREYGLSFEGCNVSFTVENGAARVKKIEK